MSETAPYPQDDAGLAHVARLAEVETELDDVEAALGRLDDESYWVCETCGGAIDEHRLASDPIVRRCERCAGGAVLPLPWGPATA